MMAFAILGMVFMAWGMKLSWPMMVYDRLDFNLIVLLEFLSFICFMIMFALSAGVK